MLKLVSIAAMAATSTVGWQHYVNPRFQFAVDLPISEVRLAPPPANGHGVAFTGVRSRARGVVGAGFNVLNQTLHDVADDDQKRYLNGRAAYRVVRANFMALSCALPNGLLLYRKSLMRGDENVFANTEIIYPASEQSVWGPVVTRMSRSFKPTAAR